MKPPTKKQLLQTSYEIYAKVIEPWIYKSMLLQFDKFCFPITIHNIELIKTSKIKPPIEKRQNTEGSYYTPNAFMIYTDAGELLFIMEDTQIAAVVGGFQLTIGETIVRIKAVE